MSSSSSNPTIITPDRSATIGYSSSNTICLAKLYPSAASTKLTANKNVADDGTDKKGGSIEKLLANQKLLAEERSLSSKYQLHAATGKQIIMQMPPIVNDIPYFGHVLQQQKQQPQAPSRDPLPSKNTVKTPTKAKKKTQTPSKRKGSTKKSLNNTKKKRVSDSDRDEYVLLRNSIHLASTIYSVRRRNTTARAFKNSRSNELKRFKEDTERVINKMFNM